MNHVTSRTAAAKRRAPRTNAKAQEVAAAAQTAVADPNATPDWMKEDGRLGKDKIGAEDRIIPRVQLAAAISTPVTEGKVEAGNFYHTVLEEDLGPELEIVFVNHTKRYTLWKPRHQGGGILARASDGRNWDNGDQKFDDIQPDKARPRHKVSYQTGEKVGKDIGLGAWGTSDPDNEDSPPAATLSHVLIAVCPTRPELGAFAILLQRTGEGVAKQLLTKIDLDRAPIFGQKYKMAGKVQPSQSGDYHQYTFTKAGYVDQTTYAEMKELFTQFEALAPKVDDREDPDAAPVDTSGDGEKDKTVGDKDEY